MASLLILLLCLGAGVSAATSEASSLAEGAAPPASSPRSGHAGNMDRLVERELPEGWKVRRTRYLELQYPPSEQGYAERVAGFGDERVTELMAELELSLREPLVVRLAPDEETFRAVQPSRPPVWAGGTAYPALGIMVLKTGIGIPAPGRSSLETTFTHEAVHLLLGEAFGEQTIPRWLNEGLARYFAREFSLEEWTAISRAVLMDGLLRFSELERRFPVGEARAELAYAQSRAFLSYLVDRFGPGLLPRLVRQMSRGSSLNEALWSEVRYGLTALEEDWRAELDRNFVWVSALTGGVSLWGVMALLLVAAWARRKRLSRERRARWAEEEALVYGPEPEEEGAPEPMIPSPRLRVIQGGLSLEAGGLQRVKPARLDDDLDEEEEEAGSREDLSRSDGARGGAAGSRAEGRVQERESDPGDDPEDRPPPGGWLH